MLTNPIDLLHLFPIRKTKKQKQSFRDTVISFASELGYQVAVEEGRFGCRNIVIGDPEKARYLVTAHYDTPAGMIIPNLITPCNFFLFAAYQIFLTVLILGTAVLPGFLIAVFTGEFPPGMFGMCVWLICLLMILGPANKNNANDNTSGVVTVLEIARTLPTIHREKVCFILFDLEEAGLIGSAAYRKKHKKATNRQIVLNLDCVGDGDHILLFPTKSLKKDRKKLTSLYKACGYFGKKSITLREKGFSIYPSDQGNFPFGVGICALNKGKFGLYLGRIHTVKDTILDQTNVNLLRAAITTYICCDAAE